MIWSRMDNKHKTEAQLIIVTSKNEAQSLEAHLNLVQLV